MKNKSVLYLTLKKKWFDMIESGVKIEEYREIKPYWIKRLEGQYFDYIVFTNGYSKNSPRIMAECKGIKKGIGKKDWGAESESYIISLGEVIRL